MKKLNDYQNINLPVEQSSIYGNVDGLSLQNLFYTRNGKFPGCYIFSYESRTNGDHYFDTKKIFYHLLKIVPEDENMEIIPYITKKMGDDRPFDRFTFCVILNKSNIYARIEKQVTESYVLFDNTNMEDAEKFIDEISQFYLPPTNDSNIYWRICASQDGYYLDKGRIKCPKNFDVNKLYNDSFGVEDSKICKFIEDEDKSGLVILHGDKGTGKSSYIKYLTNKFPNRKFVFVQPSFITLLGEPVFGSFLVSLNNHVIVLEDCENAIKDRKQNGSASAVSLLLNMTDGILSDDLGIKFICTFNDDMKNIDPALLRKGRLVSKYEFKPLSVEKSNTLLKERGINETTNKPLTLAEIFYYEDDSYESIKKSII